MCGAEALPSGAAPATVAGAILGGAFSADDQAESTARKLSIRSQETNTRGGGGSALLGTSAEEERALGLAAYRCL